MDYTSQSFRRYVESLTYAENRGIADMLVESLPGNTRVILDINEFSHGVLLGLTGITLGLVLSVFSKVPIQIAVLNSFGFVILFTGVYLATGAYLHTKC